MVFVITLIVLVLVATFAGATLYTLGLYLLFAYDASLGRAGKLFPPRDHTDDFPNGWRRSITIVVECFAMTLVVLLYPFGILFNYTWRHRKHKRRPILLLHGWKHNQSAWLWLRRRLAKAGHGPLYSFNVHPPRGPIPRLAKQVERLAERIAEETGENKLIIIGHSMGGLVGSYYAEYLAPAGTVTHVITISSPLRGSRLAYIFGSASVQQMRPDSDFITDLSKRIATNQSIRYCQVATQMDEIIVPFQNALCGADSAHQRTLRAHGHMSLLYSPTVARQILHWLRETERVPPGARVHDGSALKLSLAGAPR